MAVAAVVEEPEQEAQLDLLLLPLLEASQRALVLPRVLGRQLLRLLPLYLLVERAKSS